MSDNPVSPISPTSANFTRIYMEVQKCNKMMDIWMWSNKTSSLFYNKRLELYNYALDEYNICLKEIKLD